MPITLETSLYVNYLPIFLVIYLFIYLSIKELYTPVIGYSSLRPFLATPSLLCYPIKSSIILGISWGIGDGDEGLSKIVSIAQFICTGLYEAIIILGK